MIEKNTICELRVVCRNDSNGKYPFTIYTDAKYFYTSFEAAEAAIPGLVKKYASQEWTTVYQYVIYTFAQDTEIFEMDRDASDIAVYLPNGSLWIRTGAKGVIQKGQIYEYIDAANHVNVCIIEKDGIFETVQCKATQTSDGTIDFRSTGGTKGVEYDNLKNHSELDWLFCVDKDLNMWLFPVKELNNNRQITLRTEPTKNNQGFQTYKFQVQSLDVAP